MKNFLQTNTDCKLVESLQNRELIGFEAFYDLYAPALYGEIKRGLYKETESGQVFQESFSSIWKSISQFDPSKEHLFTWALKKVRQEIGKRRVNLLLQEIFACQREIQKDEKS